MFKFIGFLFDIIIIGYGIYMLFKSEPTIKDLACLGGLILINVIITRDYVETIKEKIKSL